MIFTSSSVTSFQDYRLQEKSIQNTSLASGLCSVRMLTSLPRISGSRLSWSGNRTQAIKMKEKEERNKEENLPEMCWVRDQKPLLAHKPKRRSVVKLPTFNTCFCMTHLTEFTKRGFLTLKMMFFSVSNTIFLYYLLASSSWDSRYHAMWLVDLRKWAPLCGEIS